MSKRRIFISIPKEVDPDKYNDIRKEVFDHFSWLEDRPFIYTPHDAEFIGTDGEEYAHIRQSILSVCNILVLYGPWAKDPVCKGEFNFARMTYKTVFMLNEKHDFSLARLLEHENAPEYK